jgi:hypothetical protein
VSALRLAVLLVVALASLDAIASACPPQPFTAPSDVRLRGDTVLIVTHATAYHDARYATKPGVDEAVRYAKAHRIPVVYLQDDGAPDLDFAAECAPDYRVRAPDGEVRFDIPATHVIVVGGHLELCLATTMNDVLDRWSRQPPARRTMTFVMDAIYSNGRLVDEGDPYFADLQRFMNIVTYGRPGGETWPKLTLLETMGVIGRAQREREYVRRILPHWERSMPADVRVKLKLAGTEKEILRKGGGGAPSLVFQLIDTASALERSPFNDH